MWDFARTENEVARRAPIDSFCPRNPGFQEKVSWARAPSRGLSARNASRLGIIFATGLSFRPQLPRADLALCAISSRSLTTHDIQDAVAKLESKAKSRVVVTTACGEVPWIDARVERALGREITPPQLARDFAVLLNYLLGSGRFPEIRYIEVPRVPQSDSAEELKGFLAKAADVKPEERPLLDAFFDKHVRERPGGGVMMDYTQETRWAVLCWRPL